MLFALSLSAQEKKQINTTVKIMNVDTIINGRNLKDVTPEEKVTLKKNLKIIPFQGGSRISLASPHITKRITMIKDGDEFKIDSSRTTNFDFKSDVEYFYLDKDSSKNIFKLLIEGDSVSTIFMGKNIDRDIDWKVAKSNPTYQKNIAYTLQRAINTKTITIPDLRNTQKFTFSNTDNAGYTTKINLMVLEASKENLITVLGNENLETNTLAIENLSFYPNFDNGKINITFNTNAKNITVRVLDNEGKEIFRDKNAITITSYTQPLELFKNGIYYLEIKSGNQSFIKKIIKN